MKRRLVGPWAAAAVAVVLAGCGTPTTATRGLEGAAPSATECVLTPGAVCDGVDLAGRDLRSLKLAGSSLRNATLTNANLSEADLTGADLTGADLTGANLTRTNLQRATLTGASFTRTVINGTDMTDAIALTVEAGDERFVWATRCRTHMANRIIDSRNCPCPASAGGGATVGDPDLGTMAPGVFKYTPYGWFAAQGKVLRISDYTTLFSLISTAWGGDGKATFALPWLDGPWAGLRTGGNGDGACIAWSMAKYGVFPTGRFTAAFPGEVVFTALAQRSMLGYGALPTDLGSLLGYSFTAFQIPEVWKTADTVMPVLGSLHLFTSSVPLPKGFVPADGRAISQTKDPALYSLIGANVPVLVAPEGYVWAVVVDGLYPSPS